jgi:hypothetical protein
MPTSHRLQRKTRAIFLFVTGALACGCNADSPASSSPSQTPTLEGHHVYVLDVVARSTKLACPMTGADATLRFGLDLDVQDFGAQGWISLTDAKLAQGKAPATEGDIESLVGTLEDGRAVFDAFNFVLGQTVLHFEDFKLAAAEGGKVEGTAAGSWSSPDLSLACLIDFSATIEGAPDVTPPDAKLAAPEPALRLPYQSIAVTADEPLSLAKTTAAVRAGDVTVPANLVFGAGERPGFASSLSVAPVQFFPAGESISILLSLVDAAGNARDVTLGPVATTPKKEAGTNLGFENGLDGWYADPPWSPDPGFSSRVDTLSGYPTYASDGSLLDVKPVAGSFLAYIQFGGRLMGHLVPPSGAKRLRLSAAVVHSPASELSSLGTGFLVQVFADGASVVKQDGQALLPVADPSAHWTGWGTITVDVPKEASSGFWVQVEPFIADGTSGGSGETTVLIDDIGFE